MFLYAPSFRCVSTKSSTKKKEKIVEALASHHAIWPFVLLEHPRYSLFDEFLLSGLNYKLYHVSMSIICCFDKLDILKHERVRFDNAISFCSNGPNPKLWNNSACWKMLNERHFFVIFTTIENCVVVEAITSIESEFTSDFIVNVVITSGNSTMIHSGTYV